MSKAAKAAWDSLVEALGSAGVLTMADANVMAAYCEAVATWLNAKAMIAASGAVLEDSDTGRMYKSPYVAVASEAVAQMQTLGSSLGLNPAARAKLIVPVQPAQEDDPAERFFKKRERGEAG